MMAKSYPVIPFAVGYRTNVDAARAKIVKFLQQGRVSLCGRVIEITRDGRDNTNYGVICWNGETPIDLGAISLVPDSGGIYTASGTSRKNRALQAVVKEVFGSDLEFVKAVKNLAPRG